MHIIQHELPRASEEAGVQRVRVAGRDSGQHALDCWLLTLAAHAATEGRRDAQGEHVLVVLHGLGKLLLAGAPQRFVAPCTLVLPPLAEYRIVNQGAEPLQLLSVRTTGTPPASSPSS